MSCIQTEIDTTVGVIISGYQGIGKSTLAIKCDKVIDLESSSYYVHGQRPLDWEYMYANAAIHIALQHKVVFVSSHSKVRNYLKQLCSEHEYPIHLFSVVPDINLEDLWIDKLRCRFQSTLLDKDYRAYMNALDNYRNNILDILQDSVECIQICSMDYDLREVLNDAFSIHGLDLKEVGIN